MKDHSSSCGWLFPHKIGGGCLALTSVCLTAILMLLAVSWSLILFSPFSTPSSDGFSWYVHVSLTRVLARNLLPNSAYYNRQV